MRRGIIMANRYSITTLTARELDTVYGCYRKLGNILERRSNKPYEAAVPYNTLVEVVLLINQLINEVEQIRG